MAAEAASKLQPHFASNPCRASRVTVALSVSRTRQQGTSGSSWRTICCARSGSLRWIADKLSALEKETALLKEHLQIHLVKTGKGRTNWGLSKSGIGPPGAFFTCCQDWGQNVPRNYSSELSQKSSELSGTSMETTLQICLQASVKPATSSLCA